MTRPPAVLTHTATSTALALDDTVTSAKAHLGLPADSARFR